MSISSILEFTSLYNDKYIRCRTLYNFQTSQPAETQCIGLVSSSGEKSDSLILLSSNCHFSNEQDCEESQAADKSSRGAHLIESAEKRVHVEYLQSKVKLYC